MADDVDGVMPRGGRERGGERSVVAGWALALGVLSPVGVVAAAVTLLWVMGQVRRDWRDVRTAGLSLSLAMGVGLGLVGVPFSWVGWLLWVVVAGVPLGVGAGAMTVGLLERSAAGAAWHPVERRRRAVEEVREDRLAAELARPEVIARLPVNVLGVFRGGDLEPWVYDAADAGRRASRVAGWVARRNRGVARYVVPPTARAPGMGLVGESGSGKTVTVERLAWLWACRGIKVIFADFKGSDPDLPERVIAAYLSARPDAVCRVWPTEPLDIWRGGPTEVANKLLMVQDFSEPFYRMAAETAVRLAVNAPGEPPVRDSATFLARLTLDWLTRAYENTPEAADVQALRVPQVMEGVRLRYAGFFAALGSQFDRGFSWEDADLTVLTIPTLAQPSDAMAAARMVLADFGGFCMGRKPRDEEVVFVVDEFSAVTGAAPMVIDLAERVRDAGGQVVACVQNFGGLGRGPEEQTRMLEALAPGGIVVGRMGNPAEVLKLAGTKHELAMSWSLDEEGRTGDGSVRMDRKLLVDPDGVRRLPIGSAYVVARGRALKMDVTPTVISAETRARAGAMIEEARVAAARVNAEQQAEVARVAEMVRAAQQAEAARVQAAARVSAAESVARAARPPRARRPRAAARNGNGGPPGPDDGGQQTLMEAPPWND